MNISIVENIVILHEILIKKYESIFEPTTGKNECWINFQFGKKYGINAEKVQNDIFKFLDDNCKTCSRKKHEHICLNTVKSIYVWSF